MKQFPMTMPLATLVVKVVSKSAANSPDMPAGMPSELPGDLSTPDISNRHKRLWVLALGTAAVWHLGPDFGEMADMIGLIACTSNKSLAQDAIARMRAKAELLRQQIAPLEASALSKVIRRTEAACGAVLDRAVRMKELQHSWDHFLTCVRVKQD